MAVNVISLNVRGLRDEIKRRAIFDFYRQRCDILCLQETHSCPDTAQLWIAEWGHKILFSHGTTNSRGTAILFKKGTKVDIGTTNTSSEGRYISYADDMDVCMSDVKESLKATIQQFDKFQRSTGFQLSYEKTTLYRLGSLKKSAANHYCAEQIRWSDEKINVLGIDIYDEDEVAARKKL